MIIESNNGQISFYSNDVARGGTTFQFSMHMEIDSEKPQTEANQQQKEKRRVANDGLEAIETVEAVQAE